ncbi:MAG: gamma-glutamyl-gamma-aminobutyrate hydrolase family protein [Micrococcales bacterium]|nr:gamma-glutamyl-gamma-aminobutyrate hydrolase family protein [Micrococcales bacterium]
MGATRILVVDNYDSFVWTIVGYLRQLGASTQVVRNDALGDVVAAVGAVDGVLVSPGPGAPSQAGACAAVVRTCAATRTPMLGVCLGHQVLAETFGATVTHARELMHGKTSPVTHDGTGVLAQITSPFTATRYHSLAVVPESVPDDLVVTAWTDQIVMALAHRTLPLYGVQFHPESVLTDAGHRILANWLTLCGDDQALTRAAGLRPAVPELSA